ncbi:phytanoyl-CoA dioxygenase family protein [Dolichospermum sp. ST_sed9]|nr:phytanoyl-CoA dioxygenase family protein [Dolichospermum sp. ST_sed9]
MITNNNLKTNLSKDGFILIRGVLTEDEVTNLRKTLEAYFLHRGVQIFGGLSQPNAAVLIPELDWVFSHPKIIDALKNLVENEKLMFTSHCDIHSGIVAGWHKDDGTSSGKSNLGYFDCLTYDVEDCQVYKVAIYLQDHTNNLAGLKVKPGSHKIASTEVGEEVYLKTRVGDVIIFDVRLTHSGQSDILPIPWLRKPLTLIRKLFGSSLDQPIKSAYELFFGTKMSIFFTFGYSNNWTVAFAKNNMKRQLKQNQSSQIFLPSTTKEKLLAEDVLLAEEYFTDL